MLADLTSPVNFETMSIHIQRTQAINTSTQLHLYRDELLFFPFLIFSSSKILGPQTKYNHIPVTKSIKRHNIRH